MIAQKIYTSLYRLLLTGKVFVKCPKCKKSLGLFEIYNEHCSFCGSIDCNKMIVVEGYISNNIRTNDNIPNNIN